MTQSAPSIDDTALWQRRLASQANNRAWRLSEATSRSTLENQEMLHAAHAAMHLWAIVGNANNKVHAGLLLAHVYALLSKGTEAAAYLAGPFAHFTTEPSAAAWEVAIAHAVKANVSSAQSDTEAHRTHYATAKIQIDALPDPEDRAILLATLHVVPAPSGGRG